MLKHLKPNLPLLALIGVSTLSLGMLVGLADLIGGWGLLSRSGQQETPARVATLEPAADSAVLKLVPLPADSRAEQLGAIAQGKTSLEQARARYLLATDLINQGRGGAAIDLLAGLERSIRHLAP
ncbi:MAG: tail length tape measure protein, partial [Leptolyngbyaceae cyanobacterium SM1_1_3]|nr:tail length tape measure protein [Leptolyngbyaceae cyanobacterium SM1_1_3]